MVAQLERAARCENAVRAGGLESDGLRLAVAANEEVARLALAADAVEGAGLAVRALAAFDQEGPVAVADLHGLGGGLHPTVAGEPANAGRRDHAQTGVRLVIMRRKRQAHASKLPRYNPRLMKNIGAFASMLDVLKP
jgi:hypothetical protein